MLKILPVRRWQSRQWHIEIFDGSPSRLKAMEPQWHCVVRDVISFYSEEACVHGTERIATPLCWRPNGMSNILPKMLCRSQRPQRISWSSSGQSLKSSQRANRVRSTPMTGRKFGTQRLQPWATSGLHQRSDTASSVPMKGRCGSSLECPMDHSFDALRRSSPHGDAADIDVQA